MSSDLTARVNVFEQCRVRIQKKEETKQSGKLEDYQDSGNTHFFSL